MNTTPGHFRDLMKQRLGFGAADFSCNLIWGITATYLMFFYTDVMGLAAADVALLFLLARLLDGAADVAVGLCIDKTNTRWGRSRPYIAFGAIPLGVFAVLSFYSPGLQGQALWAYAFITYLMLSICYSVVNIPLASILPSLTRSAKERTVLATYRIIFGALGATAASLLVIPLVDILGGGSQRHGFFLMMTVIAVFASVLLLVSFFSLKERVDQPTEPVNLKRVLQSLKHNRPWQIFTLNVFFMWGAFFLYQGGLIYFFTYAVQRPDLVPLFAGISTFVPLLGTALTPLLAARWYKRSIFTLASLVNMLGMLLMIGSGLNLTGLLMGSVIAAVGQGMRLGIYYSMQADPVDYGEWKTGVSAAGALSSIITFVGKLTMACAGAASALLLGWGGYAANQPQTPQALEAISAGFLYIPTLLVGVSMLVMQFYRLDKLYPDIRAELDRRAARQAPLIRA